MTNLFKPIDFDSDEDLLLSELQEKLPYKVTKTEYDFDRVKFEEAVKKVREEIELIKLGMSELVNHGIQLEDNAPCQQALRQLVADPFPDRLGRFIFLSGQDLTARVKNKFSEWFEGVFTPCQK